MFYSLNNVSNFIGYAQQELNNRDQHESFDSASNASGTGGIGPTASVSSNIAGGLIHQVEFQRVYISGENTNSVSIFINLKILFIY